MNRQIQEQLLTTEVYQTLRESVGWNAFSQDQAKQAIQSSLYSITVMEDGTPVAMGRLLGDGIYFMIVDVIVHPNHQGKGIGKQVVEALIAHARGVVSAHQGRGSVMLIAAKGKERFYEALGFTILPMEESGAGMRIMIE